MLAQLIQALYNIIDSMFVGKDSEYAYRVSDCYRRLANPESGSQFHCAAARKGCRRSFLFLTKINMKNKKWYLTKQDGCGIIWINR